LAVSSRAELSAEVLFLRKQLAFYQEHQVQPRKLNRRRAVLLGPVVSTIQLESGIDDRQTGDPNRLASPGFKLFWRWKSRLGRLRIPENLRQLIMRMVQENFLAALADVCPQSRQGHRGG